jgi:hypothetical protein
MAMNVLVLYSDGSHYWKQRLCPVPKALGKAHKTLGKRFAECNTHQTTLEKKTTAKDVLPSVICWALGKDFA